MLIRVTVQQRSFLSSSVYSYPSLGFRSLRFPHLPFKNISMTSLVEYVDRLTICAKSIRAAAAPPDNSPIPGPFVHAVLRASLGDTIRDIDPSEIGLFTLVQPSQPAVADVEPSNVEIARVEFLGATPLRKPPSSKYGKAGGSRAPREHEPEVYANAALKYLDR